ncbi:hypothetical protein [Psychrobacter aestuarii]|uniref:Uncharacterized protein n=1 Tax=Psychrobacter aestuarii TaxID=556327 RepID=A0ABN0W354_9GAMM|nr:hypothetical protein [Psychrobacter aestuarii]
MKTFLSPFLLSGALALTACSTTAPMMASDSTTTPSAQQMQLQVVQVKSTQNGQILFLRDTNGQEYSTVTEFSRDEKFEGMAGDTISLTALEVIQTPKVYMIVPSPRSIKIVE